VVVEIIAATAGTATIIGAVAQFIHWRRKGRLPRLPSTRSRIDGLELAPYSYRIDLFHKPESIVLDFIAINYTKQPLRLIEIKATLYTLGPTLAHVLLQHEVSIPVSRSKLVSCHRPLTDTEVRAIVPPVSSLPVTASVHVVARAKTLRRECTFESVSPLRVEGGIQVPVDA
jgi:hypothetical protein